MGSQWNGSAEIAVVFNEHCSADGRFKLISFCDPIEVQLNPTDIQARRPQERRVIEIWRRFNRDSWSNNAC